MIGGSEIPFHEYFWLKYTFLSLKYFLLLKNMMNECAIYIAVAGIPVVIQCVRRGCVTVVNNWGLGFLCIYILS